MYTVHRLNEVREANEATLALAQDAGDSEQRPGTSSHVDRLNAPLAAMSLASDSSNTNTNDTITNGNGTTSLMSQTQEEVSKEMNRVDTTLADVFQLLSLFFLTIGKSRSAPATYCQLAIITKLLDHMKESGVYTMNDVNPFKGRLNELKTMILADMPPSASKPSTPQLEDAPHPPRSDTSQSQNAWLEGDDPASRAALTKLLLKKHDRCTTRLKELITSLSVIGVELVPLHQKLITLRRQLVALSAKGIKTNKAEIDAIAEELRKIEAARVDGKFIVEGGVVKDGSEQQPAATSSESAKAEANEGDEQDDASASAADESESEPIIPPGQALLSGLLEETFEALIEIQSKEEEVSPLLQPIYERLTEMRAQLEKLNLTHRWTLRETDLYNFQVSLQEIDRMRKGGKFVDAEGNKPHGQRVRSSSFEYCCDIS
jgi:hypothetical protein